MNIEWDLGVRFMVLARVCALCSAGRSPITPPTKRSIWIETADAARSVLNSTGQVEGRLRIGEAASKAPARLGAASRLT